MKLKVLSIIFFGIVLGIFSIFRVSAHSGGPPYVTINGQYANTNPLLSAATPTKITVGSDIASQSALLIQDPIEFAIDERFFPNPYAQPQSPFGLPVVNQPPPAAPEFQWDFKDGTTPVVGNPVKHTYTKPGTYIIEIFARFPGKTREFAPVNTVQLTVVPQADYVLPQGVIQVDGTKVTDPLRDTISVKPVKPVKFDGTQSKGKIVSYDWDFGNERGASGKAVTNRYTRDDYFPTVVLRVKDENGIVSDTYALLDLPFEKPNPVLSFFYTISDFFLGLWYR